MIEQLNHVAIVVPDLDVAVARYAGVLGATVEPARTLERHGVRAAFVRMPGTAIELLEPWGEDSPVADFLRRHPQGGLHHLCYGVADLDAAIARAEAEGARVLGAPRRGAHGARVVFLHPRNTLGHLIELEEI
ncbi:MAG: methylmalonyl-CoA epimerase [Paracoccaceae bacterium]